MYLKSLLAYYNQKTNLSTTIQLMIATKLDSAIPWVRWCEVNGIKCH